VSEEPRPLSHPRNMSLASTIKHFLWRVLTKRMHLDFTLRSGINGIIRNRAQELHFSPR
jgi:hypothetical protein